MHARTRAHTRSQAAAIFGEYWLASWAAAAPGSRQAPSWLWVYFGLTAFVLGVALARSLLFFEATLRYAMRF